MLYAANTPGYARCTACLENHRQLKQVSIMAKKKEELSRRELDQQIQTYKQDGGKITAVPSGVSGVQPKEKKATPA